MTDTQDLIAQLRKDAHHHIDGQMAGLMDEAAEKLEAAQAEIERLNETALMACEQWKRVQDERDAALARLAESQAEIERLKESEQAYCELAHEAKPFVEENIKMRERLAELAEQKPLAWCQLSIGGSSIAYFDGKPIVMVGPVGNNCHTTPLFAAAGASPVQLAKVPPYLQERLQDFTCEKVEDAGGTPGYTIYKTSLGRSGPYSLYDGEALALWVNIGKALGPEYIGAVQPSQAGLSDADISILAAPYGNSSIQGFDHIKAFARAIIAAINARESGK